MRSLKFKCSRCGAEWENDCENPYVGYDRAKDSYQITRYIKAEGKNYGRFERVDLCPKCAALLDAFLDEKSGLSRDWYVARQILDENGTLGVPVLVKKDDLKFYTTAAYEGEYKVVTLESYLFVKGDNNEAY